MTQLRRLMLDEIQRRNFTFEDAYSGNREQTIAGILDNDLVAAAVRRLMADRARWEGTATELLADLSGKVAEMQRKSKELAGIATCSVRAFCAGPRRSFARFGSKSISSNPVPVRSTSRSCQIKRGLQCPHRPVRPPPK